MPIFDVAHVNDRSPIEPGHPRGLDERDERWAGEAVDEPDAIAKARAQNPRLALIPAANLRVRCLSQKEYEAHLASGYYDPGPPRSDDP
jgi:hypothetical protein